MIIFNTFFKIAKKHRSEIIAPMIIFLAFLLMSSFSAQSDYQSFKATKPEISIINHDTEIGEGLMAYLDNKVIWVNNDVDDLEEAIFYQTIALGLEIPENYTQQFLNDHITLKSQIVTNSSKGYIAQSYINEYLNYYQTFHDLGYSHQEIQQKIMDTSKEAHLDVTILQQEDSKSSVFYNFSNLMIYPLVYSMLCTIAPILLRFNQSEILARTVISAVKITKRNVALLLSTIILSHALWLIMMLLTVGIMWHHLDFNTLGYSILNTYVIMLTAVAFAFLISKFVKTDSGQNAVSNSVSLGLAFISGVFVPSSILSPVIVNISKLFPVYWNVQANLIIQNRQFILNDYLISVLIQLCYAVVLVLLAVILSRNKRKQAIN